MGNPAEAAYQRLRKRFLSWPRMRERPEKAHNPFGDACAKPSLRLNGARFVTFHRNEARRLHLALRVPDSVACDVPEAHRAPEGQLEAWFDLASRGEAGRAMELARRLYQLHTGAPPPE